MVLESVDDLYYARNTSKYDYCTIYFEYNNGKPYCNIIKIDIYNKNADKEFHTKMTPQNESIKIILWKLENTSIIIL